MSGRSRGVIAVFLLFAAGLGQSLATELEARCAEAQKKGIGYLAANQRETGGFATYEWRERNPDKMRSLDTPFTVSQVLYSLTFCADNPTARGIRERAAAYLIREREGPGIWRYRGRADKVPPDVDDTSMSWAALKRDGQSIAPEALDALRAGRNEAGLFNTWLGDPSTWAHIDSRDIDPVVNLNALLLFGLAGESIDSVCSYMVAQVDSDEYRRGSIYYPSHRAFTNALARAYGDGGVSCLKKTVPKIREATLSLQESDGGWGNDYETALALLTLVNLGERGVAVEKAVNLILSRQQLDGAWAFATTYSGAPRDGGNRYMYGARAVTTALCLEALAKYVRH